MTLKMREADLQRLVLEAARRYGFLAYHTFNSTRSAPGFPDLILVHPRTGRMVVAELKSARGKPTAEQERWLAAFAARHDAHLWRPVDWPDRILTVLAAAAGQPAPIRGARG
jgi:hypothetical protein